MDQFYKFSHKLSHILQVDKHSKYEGYEIRSLYFDSIDDRDFQEKEDGIEIRRKIRLRNYGSNSTFAKLEMKQNKVTCKRNVHLGWKNQMPCDLLMEIILFFYNTVIRLL